MCGICNSIVCVCVRCMYADCCATFSADRHLQACEAVGGYCRQRTLEVLLEEFATVAAKAGILIDAGMCYMHTCMIDCMHMTIRRYT